MNEELLERIAITLENMRDFGADILSQNSLLKPQPQIQLGFGEPPTPQYIFIGQQEGEGQGLWYSLEGDSQIWHSQKSLTGVIKGFELVNRSYKNKEQTKLDITIQADKTYIVRTGFGTVFCKGLLLALNTLNAETIKRPIALAVSPGEETVVFCRVYDAASKNQIQAEWNADADWLGILQKIQSMLIGKVIQEKEIWRSWKNPEDAIAWAEKQLAHMSLNDIQAEFDALPATNGKKAVAWVQRISELLAVDC